MLATLLSAGQNFKIVSLISLIFEGCLLVKIKNLEKIALKQG